MEESEGNDDLKNAGGWSNKPNAALSPRSDDSDGSANEESSPYDAGSKSGRGGAAGDGMRMEIEREVMR